MLDQTPKERQLLEREKQLERQLKKLPFQYHDIDTEFMTSLNASKTYRRVTFLCIPGFIKVYGK